MNQNLIAVLTRAQTKNQHDNIQQSENISSDRTDQPDVVEILKRPTNYIELKLIPEEKYISQFNPTDIISTESGSFYFIPSVSVLLLNPFTRSTLTRDVLLRDLEFICNKRNIRELIVNKDENDMKIINKLASVIKEGIKLKKGIYPKLCIIKGVKRVTDEETKKIVLNDFHLLPTSGHAGINRMVNNIKKYYFWPTIQRDVSNFVKKCDDCQKNKYFRRIKEPMVITSTANSAFQKIFLDIVGPLDTDAENNSYILTLQCELTKFTEAYPLKSKDAVTVARCFVENFLLRYGIVQEIATDRGSEFISETMTEVCKLLHIRKMQSTAYHHESIGALENSHKTLGAYLRMQTQKYSMSWSTWLPYWCFSYNTTVHTETKYTPFELVFGKLCNIPSNLSNSVDPLYNFDSYPLELKYRLQTAQIDARNNLLESKEKRKCSYDKNVNSVSYKKGDSVLVKSEIGNKLTQLYEGPFIVIEEQSPNVKIVKKGKETIVHKNRTKPYYTN